MTCGETSLGDSDVFADELRYPLFDEIRERFIDEEAFR